MNDFTVSAASLDDWQDIKELSLQLEASKFYSIVGADPKEAGAFLVNSLMHPSNVGFLLLRWRGELIGMCALMAIASPRPGTVGVGTQTHCFINSVYIRPHSTIGTKVPLEAGKMMIAGMENWGRARQAVWMYGNVRLDGRFGGLWRKFGMAPLHGTVGKAITPTSGIDDLEGEHGLELHQVVVGKEL